MSDAESLLYALPTPDHLTLLFKHHKSTTLLSILPTQSLSEIKSLLLAALQSRDLTTLPGSDIPLPPEAEDLQLGVLLDRKDASKGWVPLEVKEDGVSDVKSGKKKATAAAGGRKSTGGAGGVVVGSNTAAGLGLVDGMWVVYRLDPVRAKKSIKDEEDELDEVDVDMLDDPGWDVVLPSFDDEGE